MASLKKDKNIYKIEIENLYSCICYNEVIYYKRRCERGSVCYGERVDKHNIKN